MRLLATILSWLLAIMVLAGMMAYEMTEHFFVALLVVVALQIIVTLVHEAGHAFAARKLGARVEVIAVLWLEYDFRTRKFGAARLIDNQELGGFVLYTWEDGEPVRRDDALIAAAGPVANGLLALLALAMTLSLSAVDFSRPAGPLAVVVAGEVSPDTDLIAELPSEAALEASYAHYRQQEGGEAAIRWLEGFAAVLAALSLGIGLLSLLPYGGSDGERLLATLSRRRRRHGRS